MQKLLKYYQKIIIFVGVFSFLLTNIALAQSDTKGGGGGDEIEAQKVIALKAIKDSFLKIGFFFQNSDVQEFFKEVDPTLLQEKLKELTIKVSKVADKDFTDQYGIERTALNFREQNLIQYNLKKITNILNQPEVFFVLNFHELLGLMNLEFNDPNQPDLSLRYAISGKLAQFVSRVQNYDLIFNKTYFPLKTYDDYLDYFFQVDVSGTNMQIGEVQLFTGKCISADNKTTSVAFFVRRDSGEYSNYTIEMAVEKTNENYFDNFEYNKLIFGIKNGSIRSTRSSSRGSSAFQGTKRSYVQLIELDRLYHSFVFIFIDKGTKFFGMSFENSDAKFINYSCMANLRSL